MRKAAGVIVLALAVSAAGCKPQANPQQEAERDARDVAFVKAQQKNYGPLVPMYPQPVSADESAGRGLSGAGCSFVTHGSPGNVPIFVSNSKRAVVKLDDDVVVLTSDSGSSVMPLGTWAHYENAAVQAQVDKRAGAGNVAGEEGESWPATLILRDEHDRVTYRGAGTLACGA